MLAVAYRMIEVIFAELAWSESYSEERAEKVREKIARMTRRAHPLPEKDVGARYGTLSPMTREMLCGYGNNQDSAGGVPFQRSLAQPTDACRDQTDLASPSNAK